MITDELIDLLIEDMQGESGSILDRIAVETADECGLRSPLPKITLSSYVRRIKSLTLDQWQENLCDRLEKAFWLARAPLFEFTEINIGSSLPYVIAPSGFKIDKSEFEARKGKGTRAAIHAMPQAGKSVIISQAYPAWILGYDPVHRFRLATYNIFHSARFSVVIKNILRSPEHKGVFPDAAGHLPERSKAVEWSTFARLRINDGQSSFTALGLQSGFVGTGADTLLQDDPYKSAEEALSPVIRDKTWRFQTDTAGPRLDEASNVFIMFHRYHQDDQGGRAIVSGDFDLWRYAAEADGDYTDDESGRTFPAPIERVRGEYLSPRKPDEYYERQKRNVQVWNSQFQGRPTSESGDFFNVSLLKEIDVEELPPLLHHVRAWDNAATEGAGAFSVGVLMSVDASENYYVEDVQRAQVDTAGRERLQEGTARRDGKLVAIRHPQDPGSAGKDVAFNVRQKFKDYQIETIPVSGSKESRAYNFSKAVNSGKVFIVTRNGEKPTWFKPFREVLKNFPVGTYKDDVDAGADAFNHLDALFHRGLVIKGSGSLVTWRDFSTKYGIKIPKHWEVSAALRIAPDASLPSAWVITARAAEDAWLGETVFVVASERLYTNDPADVITGLKNALLSLCTDGASQAYAVWLRGVDVVELAATKFGLFVTPFVDDASAGLPETNWYFGQIRGEHPFNKGAGASRCYLLTDEESDQIHLRQDLMSWSYNERGEPQAYGGVVADCVRMTLYNFALSATALTREQQREEKLPAHLKHDTVKAKIHTPAFVDAHWAREHELSKIRRQEEKEERESQAAWSEIIGRAAQHKKYRR